MKFRPQLDWVLVRLDPAQERSSTIVLTEKSSVRTGVVLRVGQGKDGKPVDVAPGQRVAFFRWTQEHKNGRAQAAALMDLGPDLALIRENDVLFELLEEVKVDLP